MRIVFLFYDHMTALDAIGPHEILSRIPGAHVMRVAKCAGLIQTGSSGLVLNAEYGIQDVSQADVLLIPGAVNATSLRNDPEVLAWVASIHQTTQWTTSVCTGSLILGASGVLSGLKATSHWAALDRLGAWGAEPTESRVVEDGKVITAAGVSAGIDMALILAEKIAGREIAETLQLIVEYDPQPPFDAGSPKKVDPIVLKALQRRMLTSFEKMA